MRHPVVKIILLVIVVLLVAIQFIPSGKTVPEFDPSHDFMVVKNPPRRIATMIKNSCYDCHSYKTVYPWYSNVAPASLLLRSHIEEGREHLNFSEFSSLSREESNHALQEMDEVVRSGEMPLKSYSFLHKKARLSEEMRNGLSKWLSTGKNDILEP